MLAKLLITLLLSTQVFFPSTADKVGEVLGLFTRQEEGDVVEVSGPEKINQKNLGVEISASYAVVIDQESGKILFSKNADQVHPIASITKLMTALAFLDTNPDLNQVVEIVEEDMTGAGSLNLSISEKISLKDLLHLSLINSDNNATMALVRSTGVTQEEFMVKMNTKAKGLGLAKTNFADPTGLSEKNVSTAVEVARILDLATKHFTIKKILPLENYSFTSASGKAHYIKNTNKLLDSYLDILAGKTGYIDEAGYCFTGLIKLVNGHSVLTVVLGADEVSSRFQDTKAIVYWVETNYRWR